MVGKRCALKPSRFIKYIAFATGEIKTHIMEDAVHICLEKVQCLLQKGANSWNRQDDFPGK